MKLLWILLICGYPVFGQDGASTEEGQESTANSTESTETEGEEFLEVFEITTVSKKAEAVWEAPGVVSAVSAQQIEMFGDAGVWDVFARMPGVQNTHGTGINRTSIRGGESNTSVSHVLVLIDGRPVRASGGNLSQYSPTYTFPVDSIERIEVSRGPASVLYGTNAFEGVINIVTKDNPTNGVTFSLEGGKWNTERAEMTAAYHKGDFHVDA